MLTVLPLLYVQENINTFQAVLIRGEEWSDSFVVYMYNHTNWPTAVDGGSSIAALETADLDPEHQYIVPGSQVGDVASVVDTTNVGHPGMWVFHVGKDHRCELQIPSIIELKSDVMHICPRNK